MKSRSKASASANRADATGKLIASETVRLRGGKLWCFRMIAAVGAPVVFLGLLELALRLAGYGYPTAFLRPDSHNGRQILVQNNQFGWRFFGSELARQPYPLALTREPAPDTVRIIVFGESAAKGDPDPHFGLPRMLAAQLSLRHPGTRFEVVNAAMTAVNSHVILPIARDCARLNSDVWVIYMGNNEVVGPFGAGTVFGPQIPPLALVRSTLALKTTRTGQWLDAVLQRKARTEIPEWGGMEMFLDQQVRADDPRMDGIYRHFERNLADLLRLGRRAGVGVVLSTVAVNLKDCAPFASAHRAGLSQADESKWREQYQAGVQAQASGQHAEAATLFREAARIDGTFAELRFRQGQCALALGHTEEAREHFHAARDQDTLRFRCDSRLNELTRNAGSRREAERILLADAERALAAHNAEGVPGERLFYEHAHLTFEGNYLLARTIGEQVEQLLDSRLAAPRDGMRPWPTPEECGRRLGWTDWSRRAGWNGVLPRLRNPPFTGQFDHTERMQRVAVALAELSAAIQPAGLSNALLVCEAALAVLPDDAVLHAQAAALRQAVGDLDGAARAARRRLELLPADAEGWSQLGLILARQRQFAPAVTAFERAVQLNPRDVVALEHLAQSLAASGRTKDALNAFRRALDLKPDLGLAWLHYGQLLESLGRTREATDCYQKALMNPGRSLPGRLELAGFCQQRGWHEAAATNYVAAISSDPANAELHVGAGQNLMALGRLAEAAGYLSEAVRLSPGFAEARLFHGMVLGRQGQIPEATEQFREALRLKPDLVDARLNLGIALARAGHNAEALARFEEVLQQSPANAVARKYVQSLRAAGNE